MSIKTIFFDLGGVLIDFSHEKMCQNIAKYCQLSPELVQAHIFEKDIGERYERGTIDSQTIHSHFCQLSGLPLDFDQLMAAISDIFTPKLEMPPILEDLKKQNYSLFLLSNTCEAHFLHAKKSFDFLKLFDGYILSYENDVRKPEKAIFDIALQRSQTAREECFYTDDVSEYVHAAESYGIDSHLFENAEGLLVALENRGIKFSQSL